MGSFEDQEYERGRRDAARDAHAASQDDHLARLDGSIDEITDQIGDSSLRLGELERDFEQRMTAMEKAFGEFSAVAKALTDQSISTKSFIIAVLAVVIPIVVLFFTSFHHV